MRQFAFFALIFIAFFLSMSEAEEKLVECEKIEIKYDLKTCYLEGRTIIDSRKFLISSTEDHEMQRLDIDENKKIFYLPENIYEKYPNLVAIRARQSSIKSISNGLFDNLTVLKELYLSFNQIEEIESDSFKDLKSLEKLHLDGNRIKIVDVKTMRGLAQLKTLRLNTNEIEKIQNNLFKDLKSLKFLFLNDNKIKIVEEKAFKGLVQLEKLWLHRNQIEKIENNSFEDLKLLEWLYLDNNKIKFMNGETFASMKNLTNFELEGNVCINRNMNANEEFSELIEIISSQCGFKDVFDIDCGKVSLGVGLIIEGNATKHGQWPFVVSLYDVDLDNHFCGGSLITIQHVLTAAHCLQYKKKPQKLSNNRIIVLLGRHNLALKFERSSKSRNVQDSYIHPDWVVNDYKWDADLAILLLEEPVKFSNFIQPICLPKSWEIFETIEEGTVVGWGKSESTPYYKITEDIPRQATLKVINDSYCYTTDPEIARLSSVRTFCAGLSGVGPCTGDSGAGLYVKIGISWNLRGIVSSSLVDSDGNCNTDSFSVYTRVSDYFDWIRNTVADTSRTS